ncbi:MAG: WbqC family protein [Chitinophagaceae bacterium]|nr:WbqC family protein [Chitinophagaceae bacterium]
MTLVIDLQYFSPSIFYFQLRKSSHCIFDQYEHFQKMSFRNRCTLSGGNRPIVLSIPIYGGRNQRAAMKDVRIRNSESWQARHWKTIMSCYNKSPWFGHYAGELESLYSRKFEFLKDWNLECFKWIADKLSIETSWSLSNSYQENYNDSQFLDWRNKLKPSTINQIFPPVPRYPQVFEDRFGFIPHLSVLDFLFCTKGEM